VGAGELGHRVVAVADEHALVEVLGAADGDHVVVAGRGCRQPVEARIRLVDELVEQDPAQAFFRPRVPREERPLDDLREVAQRKNRAIEVGEVAGQDGGLGRVELRHPAILPSPHRGEGRGRRAGASILCRAGR